MKIGDKVRFLNTTGGGIVKGFQGKDIVLVEDEDGFDVPVLIREVVLIEPANDMQVRQSAKPVTPPAPVSAAKQEKPQEDYHPEETKEGEQLSVFLGYLPLDIKNLSSSGYECYLVNDSNYYLSYNYMSRNQQGWVSRNVGVIEPNTKLFLEEFEKPDLNDLERICLQFIAYKTDKPFSLKNTYSVEIKLDAVKFYKLHSFRENDYFEDNAIIYPVVRRDLSEKEMTISGEEIERAMREKSHSDSKTQSHIQSLPQREKRAILEVDLHIDELIDNTNGLSPADILDYQLTKFREVMDENKRNKGQKIVFIHGKGNGVLKSAILKELKTTYKSAYFQDASFREYGYGATMITIH